MASTTSWSGTQACTRNSDAAAPAADGASWVPTAATTSTATTSHVRRWFGTTRATLRR
jgi:hypothetical protein